MIRLPASRGRRTGRPTMKRILGALFLALALGGALAVALPADPAEAGLQPRRTF